MKREEKREEEEEEEERKKENQISPTWEQIKPARDGIGAGSMWY